MSTLQSSDASTYPRLSDDFRQKYTVDARDLMLYHGSMVPGIREFRQAQNCTFGKGIYCTSQRDKAAGYACVRASGNHDVDFDPVNYPKPDEFMPVIYQLLLRRGALADLRTADAMWSFLQDFVAYLEEYVPGHDRQLTWKQWTLRLQDHLIDKRQLLQRRRRGESARVDRDELVGTNGRVNRTFTDFLVHSSYDGVIGIEGGESSRCGYKIGIHDTYVIFDPSKLELMAETSVPEHSSSPLPKEAGVLTSATNRGAI